MSRERTGADLFFARYVDRQILSEFRPCPESRAAILTSGEEAKILGIVWPPGGRHATAANPFFSTKDKSFREAPAGRFSPRSHLLTRFGVTFR